MAFSDHNKILKKNLETGQRPTTGRWFLLDYSLAPTPLSGGELEPPTKFSKGEEGLDRISLFRGMLLRKRGWLFSEGWVGQNLKKRAGEVGNIGGSLWIRGLVLLPMWITFNKVCLKCTFFVWELAVELNCQVLTYLHFKFSCRYFKQWL